ncbi:MAG TPA: hypothetical protein VFZ38_08595 [Vicinamibacterales bacterium]|jgi:hypothetical protein
MTLAFVPLLRVQRELYAMPRGMERFREYIKTMVDAETGDLALPLVAMNPMGKDHVPALIDNYLALGAEEIAEAAVAEAKTAVSSDVKYRVALVVSDDLKGGWTNRWASEYSHRIEYAAITKRGWLVGILWTSEPASAHAVRDAVLTAIYRAEYLQTHAAPVTLGEMLDQEGYAMARAGCTTPQLDDDDLAYTRSVIKPHLGATDRATVIACLFGDRAAAALGYPPQGLSDRAGLALALSSARVALSEGRAFAT